MNRKNKQSQETSQQRTMRFLRMSLIIAEKKVEMLKKRNAELRKIYKRSCKVAAQLNSLHFDQLFNDFEDNSPPMDVRAYEELATKMEAKVAEVEKFVKQFKEEIERLEKMAVDDEEEAQSEMNSVASSEQEDAQVASEASASTSETETEELF
ncbi:uncharacterized protein LOC132264813 [Phlebotomus argentipes]|uniref:uncharacterized protein LOC132264813 n=1 Tax=Phlebotomus argentipes TaxID=94469 RepID=UPI0028930B68|nr:uncharacterized protein LOC132264813 [Phlebotomus argentipes]